MVRILHTADWHLGARLVERDRLTEHASFLDNLIELLQREKVEVLLVSGDVFDAANPPQDAVALYYDFIRRLADLKTVRAVITGGNHDSASHLNAPRELLRRFQVHVVGQALAVESAALDLGEVVIGAVPFLRERDLRQSVAGESMGDVQSQVRAAIRTHYAAQLQACRSLAGQRPVIAMGHLTVLGATTSESERDVHVGNLGAVGADVFAGFDYTALGHLHRPQKVGGLESVRYSGSPLALSFSEAEDVKSVVLLEVGINGVKSLETQPLPVTRSLVRATMNRSSLEAELAGLPAGVWAEITVKLDAPEAVLDRQVREWAAGRFEVLKVLTELPMCDQPAWQQTGPALNELKPREVFREKLRQSGLTDEDDRLTSAFDELLALHEARITA